MTLKLIQQFTLPADPASWSYQGPEDDDDFHDPDVKSHKQVRGSLSARMTLMAEKRMALPADSTRSGQHRLSRTTGSDHHIPIVSNI